MDDDARIYLAPVHQALLRPDIIAGCERKLFFVLSGITTVLVLLGQTWLTAAVGVVVWFVGIACLRAMAKSDPWLSQVYLKATKYRWHYPATTVQYQNKQ